jgi:ParB/RepB/Spo0J family partition protein
MNEKMRELMDSIRRRGLDSPIKVVMIPEHDRNGSEEYQIIYGERRWFACRELGIAEVQVIIEHHDTPDHKIYEQSILEEQLDENVQNRDTLNPLELAVGYKRLKDLKGVDQKTLSSELGISMKKLSQILSINDLDDQFKRSIMIRLSESGEELPMYPLSFLVQVRQRQHAKNKPAELAMHDAISFFNACKSHIKDDPRLIPIDDPQPIQEIKELLNLDIQTHHGKRFHKVIIKHNPNNVVEATSIDECKDIPIRISTNQALDLDSLKRAIDKIGDAIEKMRKDESEK